MGYTEKTTQRTFDLKLNLHCENCAEDVKNIVLKIKGVDSIYIDRDLELGKAIISGNVDPQIVIKKLKDRTNKHAELLGKEEEGPPKINHHEMQIVLQQNPVRIDQRKVAQRPQGLICKSVDKPMEREIHGCDPKFWSILLIVTYFCGYLLGLISAYRLFQFLLVLISAYQLFQFLLGLISETVDKPMEMKIHDCLKHDHELELKSYNKPFNCNRCREGGFKSGYRCKHCVYDLHKVCMNPKSEITHDFFPGSIFKYRKKKHGKFCKACGMEIHGHSYSCKKDNLDLHPACSKLPRKLSIIGKDDSVICKELKYKCFLCKMKKPSWLAETEVAGLCYVSERNKFSCHVHCLSLVVQEAWKRGRRDLDRNDANSKGLVIEVAVKHIMATAKRSGGEGRGFFSKAVTIFLETIISILLGDPTGLIGFGATELVKELLTL